MSVTKAFILGAGLGTRLRPLTDVLPKPLIPVFHRPLIHYALDHCLAAGIREFAINTHHLPEQWKASFPTHEYKGAPITFFHEPDLLETGGGIKNIEAWIGGQPLLVYNGDIFTNLDLPQLLSAHSKSGDVATLALRSDGPAPHIALQGSRVVDIRNQLGRMPGSHQFTGIYCIDPKLLDRLPAGEKVSVIPALLQLAQENALGAVVLDDAQWLDLGTREAYLDAHSQSAFPDRIHPSAHLDPSATVEASVVGPGASVAAEATLLNSVLWPNTSVAPGAQLTNCIVYSSTPVAGIHHNEDI